jgi:hypothetical protein
MAFGGDITSICHNPLVMAFTKVNWRARRKAESEDAVYHRICLNSPRGTSAVGNTQIVGLGWSP